MADKYKAVVIGGGVVGCSVLYHLTKFGWKDVLLLERSELTSGSSWHAAGGVHTINGDPNMAKLQQYTIGVYEEIARISGQDIGFHQSGGLLLAGTQARFEWLKNLSAKGDYLGIESRIITPGEAHEAMPLLDPSCFVGGLMTYLDGHLDPSGAVHAYAKSARIGGATIRRQTRVTGLEQRAGGGWDIHAETAPGERETIQAEHVVNAGGLWAREIGRMVGLELPVLAMEHMYLLTEDMPEVAEANEKTGKEILHAVDFEGEMYLRQERGGMLLGTYEKACKPWSEYETPWSFGHELLEPDIDRIAPSLEIGFKHFPAFANAGIRQVINGPFTFAPDGNPLVGPVRGMRNFWCACGVMAGFAQGGGVGLALAQWMIEGDPGIDVWALDVARYDSWASLRYTNSKVRENYGRRFSIRFPNEELPAARPLRTTPLYDRLRGMGAVMGTSFGLETPLWFAPEEVEEVVSWRRSTDFPHVGAEARAVRESVGIYESSGFAKYKITGAGARDWLDRLLAGKMPEAGRMALAPMLNGKGGIIGDFTLSNLGRKNGSGDRYLIIGSGVAEAYHMRWFEAHLPRDGSVTLVNIGLSGAGLALAGPNSRALLAGLTHHDVSAAGFPFMHIREMDIGMFPCLVGRVSYTGDLGFELWMKAEYQRALFDLLMEAGAQYHIRPFGARALNALRLEKAYGAWASEYRPVHGPLEAGLDRFIAYEKGDFIGRDAALRERRDGGKLRLRSFEVAAEDADPIGYEPIYREGKAVGFLTSGGYAHMSGKSVGLGYVPRALADIPDGWSVDIIGEKRAAHMLDAPLFDPKGARMRS